VQARDADVAVTDLAAAFIAERPKVVRFIALRCGNDDVDDLVHELWLKVQLVDRFIDRPLPYIFRMADRLVLDRRRGVSRQRERDNDWVYINDRLSTASEPAIAETRLIARERLDAVRQALYASGPRASMAFRLHRLDGMEQRDIAQSLGVSLSTVEKDLRKVYDLLLSVRETFEED
jgi:RNA polymerase sigma-70 factor (ECF subfamily)